MSQDLEAWQPTGELDEALEIMDDWWGLLRSHGKKTQADANWRLAADAINKAMESVIEAQRLLEEIAEEADNE